MSVTQVTTSLYLDLGLRQRLLASLRILDLTTVYRLAFHRVLTQEQCQNQGQACQPRFHYPCRRDRTRPRVEYGMTKSDVLLGSNTVSQRMMTDKHSSTP